MQPGVQNFYSGRYRGFLPANLSNEAHVIFLKCDIMRYQHKKGLWKRTLWAGYSHVFCPKSCINYLILAHSSLLNFFINVKLSAHRLSLAHAHTGRGGQRPRKFFHGLHKIYNIIYKKCQFWFLFTFFE